jgi:hypothetical protein
MAVVATAAAVGCLAAEMQSFVCQEAGIEVLFPPGTIRAEASTDEQGHPMARYSLRHAGVSYVVAHTELKNLAQASIETKYRLLEASRDQMLAAIKGELLGDRRLEFAEIHPGLHARIRLTGQQAGTVMLRRTSVYVIGPHVIDLYVDGARAACDGPEADAFLHSLAILEQHAFSREPNRYTAPDGTWQLRFPSPPVAEPSIGGGTRYVVATGSGTYLMEVSDMPAVADADAAGRRQVLNLAVKKMLMANDGTIEEQVDIRHSNRHDGLAVRATIRHGEASDPRGLYRGRLYVIGSRLYQLSVTGSAAVADNDVSDQFLNSFAVKPSPSASSRPSP